MLLQSLAVSIHNPADGPGAAAVAGDCSAPGFVMVMPGELGPGELLLLLVGSAGDPNGSVLGGCSALGVGGRGCGEVGASEACTPLNGAGEPGEGLTTGLLGTGDCPVL